MQYNRKARSVTQQYGLCCQSKGASCHNLLTVFLFNEDLKYCCYWAVRLLINKLFATFRFVALYWEPIQFTHWYTAIIFLFYPFLYASYILLESLPSCYLVDDAPFFINFCRQSTSQLHQRKVSLLLASHITNNIVTRKCPLIFEWRKKSQHNNFWWCMQNTCKQDQCVLGLTRTWWVQVVLRAATTWFSTKWMSDQHRPGLHYILTQPACLPYLAPHLVWLTVKKLGNLRESLEMLELSV